MTNSFGLGPPGYGGGGAIASPQRAYTGPPPQGDYYGASPYQGNGYPPPGDYPPPQGNGYYASGPPMEYGLQGWGPQYGAPGGYGPPQQGYGPQGYYGQPQGQYMNQRNGSGGFMEAMLASLACCCCLEACCLF